MFPYVCERRSCSGMPFHFLGTSLLGPRLLHSLVCSYHIYLLFLPLQLLFPPAIMVSSYHCDLFFSSHGQHLLHLHPVVLRILPAVAPQRLVLSYQFYLAYFHCRYHFFESSDLATLRPPSQGCSS